MTHLMALQAPMAEAGFRKLLLTSDMLLMPIDFSIMAKGREQNVKSAGNKRWD